MKVIEKMIFPQVLREKSNIMFCLENHLKYSEARLLTNFEPKNVFPRDFRALFHFLEARFNLRDKTGFGVILLE